MTPRHTIESPRGQGGAPRPARRRDRADRAHGTGTAGERAVHRLHRALIRRLFNR